MPNCSLISIPPRRCAPAGVVALLVAAASCGEDPTSPAPTVAAVEIQNSTGVVQLSVRESVTLAAVARDENGAALEAISFSWKVRDTTVAQITSTGLLVGRTAGETHVVAFAGAQSDSALVRITPVPIERVAIALDSLLIGSGYSFQLTAEAIDTFGVRDAQYPFVWSSSDPFTVRVDQTGNVQALRPGTAEIRVRASLQSAQITVNVEPGYTKVYSGWRHTCALAPNGDAFCWGFNGDGHLGNGNRNSTDSPTAVTGGHKFSELGLGQEFTCGLTVEGQVLCWGRNALAELGIGDSKSTRRLEPTPIAIDGTFSDIAVGEEHACALDTDGKAHCWGTNYSGQLGTGTTERYQAWTPQEVVGDIRFRKLLSSAWTLVCGLSLSDQLYCWGSPFAFESGAPSCAEFTCTSPTPVANAPKFADIGGSYRNTCGVTSAGVVHCWRPNRVEIEALNTGERFTSVSRILAPHTCGVTASGKGYCWGLDADPRTPLAVSGDLELAWLSGGYHMAACGVTTLGVGYCWNPSATDDPPALIPRP